MLALIYNKKDRKIAATERGTSTKQTKITKTKTKTGQGKKITEYNCFFYSRSNGFFS